MNSPRICFSTSTQYAQDIIDDLYPVVSVHKTRDKKIKKAKETKNARRIVLVIGQTKIFEGVWDKYMNDLLPYRRNIANIEKDLAEELKSEFLSKATIETLEDGSWLLVDEKKKRQYNLKKDKNGIRIYGEKKRFFLFKKQKRKHAIKISNLKKLDIYSDIIKYGFQEFSEFEAELKDSYCSLYAGHIDKDSSFDALVWSIQNFH